TSAPCRNTRPAPCRRDPLRSSCRLHSGKARASATFQQTTLLPRLTCDRPRGRFLVRAHALQPIPYPCRRRPRERSSGYRDAPAEREPAPLGLLHERHFPVAVEIDANKIAQLHLSDASPLCPAPNAHRSSFLLR